MPVHVAITRKVLPGKEEEFKKELRQFLGESFTYGGVHGAGMLTELPANQIGILRTFKDQLERDAFYQSDAFKKWERYASTVTEQPLYRELSGLEAWFRSSLPPPRRKMAIVTLCGVFPTSIFLAFTVGKLTEHFPLIIRLFCSAACMVALLTWIVMPLLTKVMKAYL